MNNDLKYELSSSTITDEELNEQLIFYRDDLRTKINSISNPNVVELIFSNIIYEIPPLSNGLNEVSLYQTTGRTGLNIALPCFNEQIIISVSTASGGSSTIRTIPTSMAINLDNIGRNWIRQQYDNAVINLDYIYNTLDMIQFLNNLITRRNQPFIPPSNSNSDMVLPDEFVENNTNPPLTPPNFNSMTLPNDELQAFIASTLNPPLNPPSNLYNFNNKFKIVSLGKCNDNIPVSDCVICTGVLNEKFDPDIAGPLVALYYKDGEHLYGFHEHCLKSQYNSSGKLITGVSRQPIPINERITRIINNTNCDYVKIQPKVSGGKRKKTNKKRKRKSIKQRKSSKKRK